MNTTPLLLALCVALSASKQAVYGFEESSAADTIVVEGDSASTKASGDGSGTTSADAKEGCVLPYPITPFDACKYPKHCRVHVFKTELLGPMCDGNACKGLPSSCCMSELKARANHLYYENNCRGANHSARNVQAEKIISPAADIHVHADGNITMPKSIATGSATPPSTAAPPAHASVYVWSDGTCNGKANYAILKEPIDSCVAMGKPARQYAKVVKPVTDRFSIYTVQIFSGNDTNCLGVPEVEVVGTDATCLGASPSSKDAASKLKVKVNPDSAPVADTTYTCSDNSDGVCNMDGHQSVAPPVVAPSVNFVMLAIAVLCGICQL